MSTYPAALEEAVAVQATGCPGAGAYRRWAKAQGYPHVEVLDWSSSAGDWQFLVSQDGTEWFLLTQTNNYPRPGFTREIDTTRSWLGTIEEVWAQIAEETE